MRKMDLLPFAKTRISLLPFEIVEMIFAYIDCKSLHNAIQAGAISPYLLGKRKLCHKVMQKFDDVCIETHAVCYYNKKWCEV